MLAIADRSVMERQMSDGTDTLSMDILVIGGSGLLGRNVLQQLRDGSHQAVGTYHTSDDPGLAAVSLDKTDPEAVSALVHDHEPDAVIDTAAYLDVDGCETNRQQAWDVNAEGTGYVAKAAASVGAHYQYVSTSYVFDGNNAPYAPQDPVSPPNFYGSTKYAGETAAKIADQWAVVRADVLYGRANANFATWAISELQAGNEITIVDDQVSRPVYAPDLASACISVAEGTETGVYHASGSVTCSRYKFTRRLADVFGFDTDLVTPITTAELGQTAPRPADSSLDSTTLSRTIDVTFRSPREAFRDMSG